MEANILAPLMFVVVFLIIFCGYPVAFALGGASLIFAFIGVQFGFFDWNLLFAMPERIFGVMSNYVLLAVPFFIFMGLVLEKAKLACSWLPNCMAFIALWPKSSHHLR